MATAINHPQPREIMLEPSRYGEPDSWKSPMILRVHCRYTRHQERLGIIYFGPHGRCRRVHGGPMEAGPYAALFPHATVIDNHGGTGAESVRMRAAGLEFDAAPGDRFLIGGFLFELRDENAMDYPEFVLVDRASMETAAVRDASVRVYTPAMSDEPTQHGDMYVMEVHGISVMLRLERCATFVDGIQVRVRIANEERPQPCHLTVEVHEHGESTHTI